MTIDQLQARLTEVRAQMSVLAKEAMELERQIATINCPFAVGDVVEFGWTRSRRKAKVQEIKSVYGRWALVARNVLKNGSLGAIVDIGQIQDPVKVSE